MKTIYSTLILLSAAYMASAQPPAPSNPVSCSSSSCTTNSTIDVCPPVGNTVVSNFQNGTVSVNNGSSGRSAGSVWRFRNIAVVSGQTVNAEITVNSIFQATLDNVDDDNADDQAGNSIASLFAPRIGPDQNLNSTDRRGYVQFTATFFRNASGVNNNTSADFAVGVSLTNINYVHYDIDGNAENSGSPNAAWFREIGVARRITPSNPVVLGNSPTDLVGYSYADGGFNWTGFAGGVCERDGVSKCAQVAASYSYTGAQPSITFRMGYDFNADGNGYNVGSPVRQYGGRFGCFNFPQQSTLPVKLLSFSGAYKNQHTILNWSTANEMNFDVFEVERSSNGSEYAAIGIRTASTSNKANYELIDDLSAVAGTVFYYRLKMMDKDGKFNYSQVIMIKKDGQAIHGVTISPNPVMGGMTSVKMTAASRGTVELRISDLSGRLMMKQMHSIYEGNNSISVNVEQLKPGIYTLQLIGEEGMIATKISIVR